MALNPVGQRLPIQMCDQIGDGHHTVQRLYRGLMVIEQAEREKVYDREDRFRQRFAFSHIYTGLDSAIRRLAGDCPSYCRIAIGRARPVPSLSAWERDSLSPRPRL